jgi:diguanylate cyclase (GGDEF)-like protein
VSGLRHEDERSGRASDVRWQQEHLRALQLVEMAPIGMGIARYEVRDGSLRFVIVDANPAARALLGRGAVGSDFCDLLDAGLGTDLRDRCVDVLLTGTVWRSDVARSQARPERVLLVYVFPMGRGAVGLSIEDVTERARAASALRHQALHDGLTGLPNRRHYVDRLRRALDEAERRRADVAVLVLDLNRFKQINDAMGHHHGDRLLVMLAERLRTNLRECDVIARLGGDEFALVLTRGGPAVARAVAARALGIVHEPFDVDGVRHSVTASIGIAVYPHDGDDADHLTRLADAAMYAAKRNGGGVVVHRSGLQGGPEALADEELPNGEKHQEKEDDGNEGDDAR